MGVPAAAFVGALATAFVVYRLARLGPSVQVATLLLAGIAVAAIISAVISLVMTFSGQDIRSIYFWLLGGLGARGWQSIVAALPFVVAGIGVAMASASDLNLTALGEERASQLGLEVDRFKTVMLGTGSLLTAAAVSVAGLIGFVGLMTPHIVDPRRGRVHDPRRPRCPDRDQAGRDPGGRGDRGPGRALLPLSPATRAEGGRCEGLRTRVRVRVRVRT